MDLNLKGKIAVVTGGSKGIGEAIAKGLAQEGCKVVIAARGQQALDKVALEITNANGICRAHAADLTKMEDIQTLLDKTVKEFGTVHILINNVGGIRKFIPFELITDQEWLETFQLNVFSTVKITRAFLPFMQKQQWGRIINISSESGVQPDPMIQHYNAAKAAINNITKSLSKAYCKDGILINAVSPAFILTSEVKEMIAEEVERKNTTYEEVVNDFIKQHRSNIGLKRPGQPEEVASLVVFLASELASFITGANFRVDGGSVSTL